MIRYHKMLARCLVLGCITVVTALFTGKSAQAATIKLNHPLPADTAIGAFTISPDGRYVIYPEEVRTMPTHPDSNLLVTLYRVEVDGQNPTAITYPTDTDEGGLRYWIPPGSQYLYYRGQKERGGQYGLYKVPISGPISATIQLDKALPTDWQLGYSYEISHDEHWMVYEANYLQNFGIEKTTLYAVSTNGPAATGVQLNIPDNSMVRGFTILPDNQHVVYAAAKNDGSNLYHFYSISLNAPNQMPIQLNPPLIMLDDDYTFSHNGQWLIYFENKAGDSIDQRAIFSVPTAGPMKAAVQLSLAPTPYVQIGDFALSRDDQALIYSLYPQTDTVATLYRVPLAGPAKASMPLNSRSIGGRYIIPYNHIQVTPNSQQIVYAASQTEFGELELYSVPLNGPISATVQLSAAQVPDGGVSEYIISQDSQWVLYTADQETDTVFELYRAPISGPANSSVKLNSQLVPDYDVGDFLLTPNRQWVVYESSYFSTTNSVFFSQLHVVPLADSASASVPLTEPGVSIDSLAVTSDNRKVIYRRGLRRSEELYATDLPQPVINDVIYLPAVHP